MEKINVIRNLLSLIIILVVGVLIGCENRG
jgi:hypothetical protein